MDRQVKPGRGLTGIRSKSGPWRIEQARRVQRATQPGVKIARALAITKFNSTFNPLAREGREGERQMKPSIMPLVVATFVLAGTIAAQAQPAEAQSTQAQSKEDGDSSTNVSSTDQPARSRRTRGRAERATGAASARDIEGLLSLPSVFRNCWEPLPWYCAKPAGSLWFGSPATLHHYRCRTVSFRIRQGRVCG